MGKKSQPAPPPAPNVNQMVNAQAQANRVNQYTPFGSLTYSGPNNTNANLAFDPRIQQLFDSQIGLDNSLLGAAQNAVPGIQSLAANPANTMGLPNVNLPQLNGNVPGLDFSGLQELDFSQAPGMPGDATGVRDQAERAFFDRSAGLLDEQYGRQEDRLRNRLANQGFQAGSEGFGADLGQFSDARNEAFQRLANDAVLFGGQEASRTIGDQLAMRGQGISEQLAQRGQGVAEQLAQFGAGLQGAGFQNQTAQQGFQNQGALRSQLLQEQLGLRGNQFNELASILGLQQVQQPTLQNFYTPGQVDVLGAYGLNSNALQNNFNTQSNAASRAKGAGANLLGTLGGAFIGRPNPG